MCATKTSTQRRLKVTAVGDGTVGKTCLLMSYVYNTFPVEYIPTVFENHVHDLVVDGVNFAITLWDTAGQEDFERLRPLSYPNTDVFLLCYAINNRTSYENVTTKWYPELKHHCPDTPIVLVGTKADLRTTANIASVSSGEGRKLKQKIRAELFVECSALTRQNLDPLFEEAVRVVMKPKTSPERRCKIL